MRDHHSGTSRLVRTMTQYKTTILRILCLVCLLGTVMLPASAAPVNGTLYKDSPEHIAAMKAYVAYAGEKTEARMDGAIGYIGTISNGVETGRLSAAQSQYTGIVSSVQEMNTCEQIHDAETQMRTAGTDFTSAARTEVKQYNGTEKALAAAIKASVTARAGTITPFENAWWTARTTNRMNEFTANDARRTATIANLSAKGVDVTQAQSLEAQIKEAGAALSTALASHDEKAVKAANEQLAALDKQFAAAVKTDAWSGRETARLTAFDKETSRMQGELANLTAKGTDVTQAQAVLTQRIAERDQLKSALDADDAAALKTVNAQVKALDTQFAEIVKGYHEAKVKKAKGTPTATGTPATV
jgi:hypothetical protein